MEESHVEGLTLIQIVIRNIHSGGLDMNHKYLSFVLYTYSYVPSSHLHELPQWFLVASTAAFPVGNGKI